MAINEGKNGEVKYLYYDYHEGYIAREIEGNHECASERFEFYLDGEWVNDWDLSLNLSDATMCVMGYSMFDYEELTEEEAMRRIAKIDNK